MGAATLMIASGPSEQEIAVQAYLVWEAAGRPHGRAVEHWLKAEAQLRAAWRQRGNRYGLVLKPGSHGHRSRYPCPP